MENRKKLKGKAGYFGKTKSPFGSVEQARAYIAENPFYAFSSLTCHFEY